MRDSIAGLLDQVGEAVSESRGVLPEATLDVVTRRAQRIRSRLAYPDDVVVAALAGGTGSGKSSLFNAIVSPGAAETGGVRPTTTSPLASIPLARRREMTSYIESLGVTEAVHHDDPDWLCLIDLPDTDSVEVGHRLTVDALLPNVDVVAWVTDPEKYNDASLHHGLLSGLAAHGRQFRFALNQADRLEEESLRRVVDDLTTALRADGIADPSVIVTAAEPDHGPPVGVADLVESLREMLKGRVVYDGLLVDLEESVRDLELSPGIGPGVDFESRWRDARSAFSRTAEAGDPTGAARAAIDFVEILADEVGGRPGEDLHLVAARAGLTVNERTAGLAARGAGSGGESSLRAWLSRLLRRDQAGSTGMADTAELERSLDDSLGAEIRGILSRRARATAALSGLAVAVAECRSRASS